jgi:hypothetical protein
VSSSADRREFLRRAGLGAAAAGAWVAPQVLGTATVSAACTPVDKFLQVAASGATSGESMTNDPNLPGCKPSTWVTDRTDGITFTPNPTNLEYGGTLTITSAGCTPVQAKVVKYCPSGSGSGYVCINGTIVGNDITFPALTLAEQDAGCVYQRIRVYLTCCT